MNVAELMKRARDLARKASEGAYEVHIWTEWNAHAQDVVFRVQAASGANYTNVNGFTPEDALEELIAQLESKARVALHEKRAELRKQVQELNKQIDALENGEPFKKDDVVF